MSTQDEIFSAVATHSLYTTVSVFASREGVNVIIPGTGYRGEGNHVYERPRGKVADWLKPLVIEAARSEGLDWTRPGWDVLNQPSYRAGHYKFSVWKPKAVRAS